MTEFMQKTENSYLWPSRFESNPQSYGSKGARNFADVAHCVMHTRQELGWYIVKQNHMYSHNDDGYQSYYYYCGDVTMFLNTTWVPALAWLTLNILPILLLAILSNVTNLNIFLKLPDIIPLALLSHFIIWTVKENQEAPNSQTAQKLRKYGLSKLSSALNILITGVSTVVTLYLCLGPRFGPGDGAFLRFFKKYLFCQIDIIYR